MHAARLRRRMGTASLAFDTGILERLVDRDPDNLDNLAALGEAYTRLRRYRQGLAVDHRLVAARPDEPVYRYNLACSLALTRDLDGACQALLTAIGLGYRDFEHLAKDADLRHLRADHRFGIIEDRIQAIRRIEGGSSPE